MTYSTSFATQAVAWRGALKQSDAAARLGIHQTTLSRIEAGERGPTLNLLARMREAYGLTDEQVASVVSSFKVTSDGAGAGA